MILSLIDKYVSYIPIRVLINALRKKCSPEIVLKMINKASPRKLISSCEKIWKKVLWDFCYDVRVLKCLINAGCIPSEKIVLMAMMRITEVGALELMIDAFVSKGGFNANSLLTWALYHHVSEEIILKILDLSPIVTRENYRYAKFRQRSKQVLKRMKALKDDTKCLIS